ncbi:MAG TPA: NAD-dependent epimerase/dehydratase family protein, partial [Opitutus sp.]|nr:NAD-dependent epimerase/dehydratase family protein [Opitutus sp.]
MKVLVTGAAGFIGYHVARRLAETKRCEVLGIDNLNDYYSVDLKRARLAELEPLENFRFVQADFADAKAFDGIYTHFKPQYVVHLGAQAGVRYSLENPAAYARSNLDGFLNVLEACRKAPPKHLVFASSSSVYGASAQVPFSEDAPTDQPISFYAATKKSNELMAHSHAHLHGLAITGLRFFTVYGPWGRPDMAPTLFAKAICEGRPITLFNHGQNRRDFTYVDDIVDGIVKVLLYPPPGDAPLAAPAEISRVARAAGLVAPTHESAATPRGLFRIFNIGHHRSVEVLLFVRMLEELLGKKALVELAPPQPGDMIETCANIDRLHH